MSYLENRPSVVCSHFSLLLSVFFSSLRPFLSILPKNSNGYLRIESSVGHWWLTLRLRNAMFLILMYLCFSRHWKGKPAMRRELRPKSKRKFNSLAFRSQSVCNSIEFDVGTPHDSLYLHHNWSLAWFPGQKHLKLLLLLVMYLRNEKRSQTSIMICLFPSVFLWRRASSFCLFCILNFRWYQLAMNNSKKIFFSLKLRYTELAYHLLFDLNTFFRQLPKKNFLNIFFSGTNFHFDLIVVFDTQETLEIASSLETRSPSSQK